MNSTHKCNSTSHLKWNSFPYFKRNTKLLNQQNPINIVYFDFCKATDMAKKMKTRVEKSRWLKLSPKSGDWQLVTSEKVICVNVQKLCIWCFLLIHLLITWLIDIKSVGDLKLGRKCNSLYDRTKIKLVPCAEKCTQTKLIKIEQ